MSGMIAKQPNGLYCRISTVVDAPTHWNMTEQDYIDMCVEKAEKEAKDVIANYCYRFDDALERVRYGKDTNMTTEEYEKFIKDCNSDYLRGNKAKTYFERSKNMSLEEMAEFLANEAFIIWRAEQSIETFRKLNATQIRAVTQHYYNYFHELLRREVKE